MTQGPENTDPSLEGERLQKLLARAGYGSRRVCEILIAEGRVTVNGRIAELGNRVDAEVDVICVDGAMAPLASRWELPPHPPEPDRALAERSPPVLTTSTRSR